MSKGFEGNSEACVGDGTPFSEAMSEYETQTYRHGRTDENAIAVDAAAEQLYALYNASKAEANAVIRDLLPYVATMAVGCHGDKCREPWCYSCNGEEEADEAAGIGLAAYQRACEYIRNATGGEG